MQLNPGAAERAEIYRSFIEYVRSDLRTERIRLHRRMFSAFLWCFLMPVFSAAVILVLVRFRLFPPRWGGHLDWLIVIFPVFYAIYVLSSDVLRDLPAIIRKGGMSSILSRALEEERWRARVCEDIRKALGGLPSCREGGAWRWLARSFRTDLLNILHRTRYLTALAGAVFFLLMQGIDALYETPADSVSWQSISLLSWVEASSKTVSQFVGLCFFLILFYISGSQTYYSLLRYLNCVELILLDQEPDHAAEDDGFTHLGVPPGERADF